MKPWLTLIYGLLLGLLIGGLIILIANPSPGNAITLNPAPTATSTPLPSPTKTMEPILVQISGEVAAPGIYSLQKNARLDELIALAGGMTIEADLARVNEVALLHDGDYFYIPAEGEAIPETAANSSTNLTGDLDPQFEYPLDLNAADQEALESLPGIGPAKATDILAYREAHGGFTSIEELENVPGIGKATVESLLDYLYVEP